MHLADDGKDKYETCVTSMNEHLNIKRNGKGHDALRYDPLTYEA